MSEITEILESDVNLTQNKCTILVDSLNQFNKQVS
jgi:hypothetical protein